MSRLPKALQSADNSTPWLPVPEPLPPVPLTARLSPAISESVARTPTLPAPVPPPPSPVRVTALFGLNVTPLWNSIPLLSASIPPPPVPVIEMVVGAVKDVKAQSHATPSPPPGLPVPSIESVFVPLARSNNAVLVHWNPITGSNAPVPSPVSATFAPSRVKVPSSCTAVHLVLVQEPW